VKGYLLRPREHHVNYEVILADGVQVKCRPLHWKPIQTLCEICGVFLHSCYKPTKCTLL